MTTVTKGMRLNVARRLTLNKIVPCKQLTNKHLYLNLLLCIVVISRLENGHETLSKFIVLHSKCTTLGRHATCMSHPPCYATDACLSGTSDPPVDKETEGTNLNGNAWKWLTLL